MSVKLVKKEYVDGLYTCKTATVSTAQFEANVAKKIATTSQIGCNIQKMVSKIDASVFTSIESTNNFIFSIFVDSNGQDVYFVTNKSQKLAFNITWIEKNY